MGAGTSSERAVGWAVASLPPPARRVKEAWALCLLLCGLAWGAAPPALPPASPDGLMAFANRLRDEGDCSRAITEYRRLLFHFPRSPHADAARLEVARCTGRAGKWREAEEAYAALAVAHAGKPLGLHGALGRAVVLFGAEQFGAAASAFSEFVADYPKSDEAAEARWLLAWSHLLAHQLPRAQQAFAAIRLPNPHAEAAAALARECAALATRRKKSPLLAGILGIVPGLGHFYCGRTGDGITSLAVNAAFGWGTVSAVRKGAHVAGTVLGLLGVSFYGGSVLGGVNWAHRVNRADVQQRIDALRREHGV